MYKPFLFINLVAMLGFSRNPFPGRDYTVVSGIGVESYQGKYLRRKLSVLEDKFNRKEMADSDYLVDYSISLEGQEALLNSEYLRVGFERTMKNFINLDIRCNEENSGTTLYYSIEIPLIDEGFRTTTKKVKGVGKCRGTSSRCNRKVKQSATDSGSTGDSLDFDLNRGIYNFSEKDATLDSKANECKDKTKLNIFEQFDNIIETAESFTYNLDVTLSLEEVGKEGTEDSELDSELEVNLNFGIDFLPKANGLDQVNEVDFEPLKVTDVEESCLPEVCEKQSFTMREIFNYFGVPIVAGQHECLYDEVNCNEDNNVTQFAPFFEEKVCKGILLAIFVINVPSHTCKS